MSHTGSNNSISTVTATIVVLIRIEHQQVRVCSSAFAPSSTSAPSTAVAGAAVTAGEQKCQQEHTPPGSGQCGAPGVLPGKDPCPSSLHMGGQAQRLPGALWEENCQRGSPLLPVPSALLTKADLPWPSPPCAPDPRPPSSSGVSLQHCLHVPCSLSRCSRSNRHAVPKPYWTVFLPLKGIVGTCFLDFLTSRCAVVGQMSPARDYNLPTICASSVCHLLSGWLAS